MVSPHTNGQSGALRGRGTRDRWVYHLCGNPRSKSWQASALAGIGAIVCVTALMFPATSVVPPPLLKSGRGAIGCCFAIAPQARWAPQ
jgi:hypothetical protein